ncbi:MAG: EVE domain-containing protein [Myxococcaceae bacterium]|jgi:predicted RNA-binding protein with PUA-like domain|nr:EVE domain-containing protein [Myxococcaceae bacterium]
MNYWLMKSEPDVFSIDDLERDGTTGWEGVRNYQARNFMRDQMAVGDLVLYYHSNAEPSGVAGVAKVAGPAIPDPTQFDKKSEYYDAASKKADPTWKMVTVGFVEKFSRVVSLAELKAEKSLAGMGVLQKGQRLSVMPVTKPHFTTVLKLARAKTKA